MKQQALIQWISRIVGGRTQAPSTDYKLPHYSAPAKFQGWQSETWSLNVRVISGFHDYNDLYRTEIWFLADNAPVEVLRPGAQFALYEGTKVVAVGQCI